MKEFKFLKLNLKMPDYCKACGYACCNYCHSGPGRECVPDDYCNSFPLYLKSLYPELSFGAAGFDESQSWGVIGSCPIECQGLNIRLFKDALGDILKSFTLKLNQDPSIESLSEQGVTLEVIQI